MKVTWEEKDIVVGRQIIKESKSEKCIIGYLSYRDTDDKFVVISICDGMVSEHFRKCDLAPYLTKQGFVPIEVIIQKE